MSLANLGKNDGLSMKAANRILITQTYDDSAALNKIAISSLVANELPITVLQALMNKYWHDDTGTKIVPTPRFSEFAIEDGDPVESESDWYKEVMQVANRDVNFLFNSVTPRVLAQFQAIADAGTQISFYIITQDNKLVGKFDGEYIVPFQIQSGSLYVTPRTLPSYNEHAKNAISFRLDETYSMNEMSAIPVSGGYVTSDDDYYSLIDATCVVSAQTTAGATFTITRTAKNPATGVNDPVTGIAFDEIVITDSSGSDDSPAASGNWEETSDGVYVWTETLAAETYTAKFSHEGVDVATVSFTIAP